MLNLATHRGRYTIEKRLRNSLEIKHLEEKKDSNTNSKDGSNERKEYLEKIIKDMTALYDMKHIHPPEIIAELPKFEEQTKV